MPVVGGRSYTKQHQNSSSAGGDESIHANHIYVQMYITHTHTQLCRLVHLLYE